MPGGTRCAQALRCAHGRPLLVRHAGVAVPRRSGGRARRARPGRGRRRPGRRVARARARSVSTTFDRVEPSDLRAARGARALHHRRDAVERGAAQRDPRRSSARGSLAVLSIHSATDSCYGWDEYGVARRRPFRRSPVDADVHRRCARPVAPGVRASRHRMALARRGVPIPRSPPRRASAAPRPRRRARSHRAPAPGHRRSATRSPGVSPKAGAACSRPASGTSRGAWETPAYLRHLAGGLRLGARRRVIAGS